GPATWLFLFGFALGGGDKIAAAEQELFSFGDDAFDDLGGRRDIMDQADGLAGKDDGDIEVAGGSRREIFRGHLPDLLQELHLVPAPAPHMLVDQAAPR